MSNDKTDIDATPHRNVEAFARDVDLLFRRAPRSGGRMQRWVYHNGNRGGHQPTGDRLWTKFLGTHELYYPLRTETELISWKQNKERLLKEVFKDADVAVDIGSGGREAVEGKVMPVVLASGVKLYVPVDLSYGLLTEATEAAREIIAEARADGKIDRRIRVSPLNGDFYKAKTPEGKDLIIPNPRGKGSRVNRTAFFLGSTITNMPMNEGEAYPVEKIIERIQQVSKFLRQGTTGDVRIVFGYDANEDMEDARSAYANETWSQLIEGVMLDIQNVLKPRGHFNPVGWKHEMVIDNVNNVIHQCVVATEDQDFWIGENHYDLKEGERFVIKNNFKYPFDRFREFAEAAGLEVGEAIRHPDGRMVLQPTIVPQMEDFPDLTAA